MNLDRLLKSFKDGEISIEDVKNTLRPVEDLGFAQLDLHREKRIGFPEVIFGENKTTEKLIRILQSLVAKGFGAGYFVGLLNQNMNGAIKNENV